MTTKFLVRLINQVDNFDLQKAEELCLEIHKAESTENYELSNRENKYWLELTDMINEFYGVK